MFSQGDRRSLAGWMESHGGVQEFLKMLPELALEQAIICEADENNKPLRIKARGWRRLARKLEELAAWSAEVGPESGCR
jgi:hypothetical protein